VPRARAQHRTTFDADGEERYLEPEERVLDLVAYWQRLAEEEKHGKVVFKVHLYFDPAPEDLAAHHVMYTQVRHLIYPSHKGTTGYSLNSAGGVRRRVFSLPLW
jgi:hypothetical protein